MGNCVDVDRSTMRLKPILEIKTGKLPSPNQRRFQDQVSYEDK